LALGSIRLTSAIEPLPAAQVASQLKAQQVVDERAQGGSRFNLRWSGSIPAGELTPEAVMKLLADYVDFSGAHSASCGSPAQQRPAASAAASNTDPAVSPTAQLKNGMRVDDATTLLGQGRQISETTTADGLKTQVFEYLPGDRRARSHMR
jgi:hypothetical protein